MYDIYVHQWPEHFIGRMLSKMMIAGNFQQKGEPTEVFLLFAIVIHFTIKSPQIDIVAPKSPINE